MRLLPISVMAYSGFRAEERPQAFEAGGVRQNIVEILSAEVEQDLNRRQKRKFKVRTDGGIIFRLSYAEAQDEWFLELPGD